MPTGQNAVAIVGVLFERRDLCKWQRTTLHSFRFLDNCCNFHLMHCILISEKVNVLILLSTIYHLKYYIQSYVVIISKGAG